MTTQMVDKSNFDNKQYKADLQCAYDCGYAKGQFDILEKIRQESVRLTERNIMAIGTRADGRMDIIEIIDKHISELKGEQK